MKDHFFDATRCDRCGASLNEGRIMSMYNTDVLCMTCKKEETKREDYVSAVDAAHREEASGNRNFVGIGL